MTLKHKTKEPLYKQLREMILRKISEEYTVGSRISPELEAIPTDGFILMGDFSDRFITNFAGVGKPYVLGIYPCEGEDLDSVASNDVEGAFDDICTAPLMSPPLTTIRVERKTLVANIIRQLKVKMGHYYLPPTKIRVSNKLLIRESTKTMEV